MRTSAGRRSRSSSSAAARSCCRRRRCPAPSELVKPEHFAVANAIGAAIAQVGGEVDRVFSLERHAARRGARRGARQEAVEQGGRGRRRAGDASGSSTSRRCRSPYLPGERDADPRQGGRRPRPREGGRCGWIGEAELDDIAVGAAILGTGGGGDPYIGKLLAQAGHPRATARCRSSPSTRCRTTRSSCPSAMMGAPTVMVEKLPRGDEVVNAFEALGRLHGPQTDAHDLDRGRRAQLDDAVRRRGAARASRSSTPTAWAARSRRSRWSSPTMHGVSATPMALADEKGNSAVIDTIDNRWTERLARSLTVDFGCHLDDRALSDDRRAAEGGAFVAGTLSLAEELGRLVRETRAAHGDPIGAVVERLGGAAAVRRQGRRRRAPHGGRAGRRPEVRIEGSGDDAGSALVLQIPERAPRRDPRRRGRRARCPDLIVVLDAETGGPITTEELRYGFRVVVIGAPCVPDWRTEEGSRSSARATSATTSTSSPSRNGSPA